MNVKAIFQRRQLWTIALYKLKTENEVFELDKFTPFHFFGEKGLRRNVGYQAITADPFLFVHNDRLYLFYEIQTNFGVGEIWAQSMDAEGVWTNHGQVLKEDFHLSYPQVFFHNEQIWMIPEAAHSGKVWLYTAEAFPNKWRKTTVLIDEPLVDTSIIIQQEGIFLLGTTREYELKIYFATDLNQKFVPIGGVISNDKSIARNAGSPIYIKNVLYRVAQNCKYNYGKNITLLQIDQLSTGGYREHITVLDLYKTKPKWMIERCHHINTVWFNNEYFVAVDGVCRDKYLNTLLLALFKIFT